MPWSPRLQASERGQGPGVRGEGMHALIAALVTQDPALRRLMRCDPHSISSLYYRPTLNPAPTLLTGLLAPHSVIHAPHLSQNNGILSRRLYAATSISGRSMRCSRSRPPDSCCEDAIRAASAALVGVWNRCMDQGALPSLPPPSVSGRPAGEDPAARMPATLRMTYLEADSVAVARL